MERTLRRVGNALLWVLAILGVLSGALWVASQTGVVQPVVVATGSMSPGIEAGDLLLARRVPASDIDPGDILTLHSPRTGNFVTHRVVEVTPDGEVLRVTMKGDANAEPDAETYPVPTGDRVWQPFVTIPGFGVMATEISRPGVAIPALVAILALIGLTVVPSHRGRHQRRGFPRVYRTSPIGASKGGHRALTLTLFTLAAVVMAPGTAGAQEQQLAFTVEFDDLVSGQTQQLTRSIELEGAASLVDFLWMERSGILASDQSEIEVTVCSTTGTCVAAADPGSTRFAAGTLTATVTVTLTETAPQGGSGMAVGQLVFADDVTGEGSLPITGTRFAELGAAAVALVAVGALILRLTRRRHEVPR